MHFETECSYVIRSFVNEGEDAAEFEYGLKILERWCKDQRIDPLAITTEQAQELKVSLLDDPRARRGISALYHQLATKDFDRLDWDPWSRPSDDPEWKARHTPKPAPPVRKPLAGEVAIHFDEDQAQPWEARLGALNGRGGTPAEALDQLAAIVSNLSVRREPVAV